MTGTSFSTSNGSSVAIQKTIRRATDRDTLHIVVITSRSTNQAQVIIPRKIFIKSFNWFSKGLTDSLSLQVLMAKPLLVQKWSKRIVIASFSVVNDDKIKTKRYLNIYMGTNHLYISEMRLRLDYDKRWPLALRSTFFLGGMQLLSLIPDFVWLVL